jgi:cobalamin biosynthesis protein CbiG
MGGKTSTREEFQKPLLPSGTQVAAVAVSRLGSALAQQLAAALPKAVAYVPDRFAPPMSATPATQESPQTIQGYEGRVASLIAALFLRRVPLVLVMATGAAVRLVAPLLAGKTIDPAVVVVDDAGRFAISLLSGHAGGANELAVQVASLLGATAVITTASEAAGVPSIELVAASKGWRIEPGALLTRLAAALINGEPVGVYQDSGARHWLAQLPATVQVFERMVDLAAARPSMALIVSDRVLHLPNALADRTTIFRPPMLVLGVGCSRGATAEEIAALVDGTLLREALAPLAVCAVSTIDRRQTEPGLRQFVESRGWPLITYSAPELAACAGEWTPSEAVQRAVGTGGVAEPAALLAAGARLLTVRKVKSERVTLAIARRSYGACPRLESGAVEIRQ